MKRTIAIVAGGDSSELVVSLRSAQGLYSFIDKERYNLYIVEMEGTSPTSPSTELRGKTVSCKVTSTC